MAGSLFDVLSKRTSCSCCREVWTRHTPAARSRGKHIVVLEAELRNAKFRLADYESRLHERLDHCGGVEDTIEGTQGSCE